jgi:Ran-binding protein 1
MSSDDSKTEAPTTKNEEEAKPAPVVFGSGASTNHVFGSGSAFGTGSTTKFNPSAFASTTTATTKPEEAAEEGEDEDVERECTKEFTPVVKLEIIESSETKTTGEENENILFEAKTKAYRFLEGEWKERGLGPMKILEHKATKKCRLLMRRDKTLKICANFYIDPETKVTTHAGSEKARVFTTVDCSDGDEAPALQNMCIKFGSEEKAQLFQDKFEEAQKIMASLLKTEEEGEKEEKAQEGKEKAEDLADDLAEKLSAAKKDEE